MSSNFVASETCLTLAPWNKKDLTCGCQSEGFRVTATDGEPPSSGKTATNR